MRFRWVVILCGLLLNLFVQQGVAHENLLSFIDRLTVQLRTNANNADLLIQRADVYRLHENWAEARADYAAAQKLTPNSIPLLLGLAQLQVDTKEDAVAKLTYDRALAQEATNAFALFGRGRVLARLRQWKAAIADYSRGLALTDTPQADQFLERANLQAAETGAASAIKGLDEGMARLGWMVSLQTAAIDLEIKRHQPDEALARLETIIARSTRKESWLARKGEILSGAKREPEARAAYDSALKAIDELPPRMRSAPAMIEVRAKIVTAMASLTERHASTSKD